MVTRSVELVLVEAPAVGCWGWVAFGVFSGPSVGSFGTSEKKRRKVVKKEKKLEK